MLANPLREREHREYLDLSGFRAFPGFRVFPAHAAMCWSRSRHHRADQSRARIGPRARTRRRPQTEDDGRQAPACSWRTWASARPTSRRSAKNWGSRGKRSTGMSRQTGRFGRMARKKPSTCDTDALIGALRKGDVIVLTPVTHPTIHPPQPPRRRQRRTPRPNGKFTLTLKSAPTSPGFTVKQELLI